MDLFIDLAITFDTVDHGGILLKNPNSLWFGSYYKDRSQEVLCSGILSNPKLIKYGVPLQKAAIYLH